MDTTTLLLAGDVMTGRGVDQIMSEPLPPVLYEPWVKDARDYVRLAERVSGPMAMTVSMDLAQTMAMSHEHRPAAGRTP